jgi:N-acetylglucosaminyl-diphospho-decaprenol L-rhamnosyltransferase
VPDGATRGFDGVGVVVLTHGSGGEHAPLLASLIGKGVPATSIVVVHNPTRPGEPLPEVPEGCEAIQAEKNLGYAAGMNLGLARLRERGGWGRMLLLTHDALFHEGALEELVATGSREPGFGVLAPALVLPDDRGPFSYGGLTNRNGTTEHIRARPRGDGAGIAACDWVDGGTMLIAAEVFERVGDFDERFWGYCEESDLCLRARRAGWGVGVVLDAVAEQDPGGGRRPGVWSYLLTRNGAEYARRAVGPRGVVSALARASGTVLLSLARVPLRVVRRRPGGTREPWLLAVGTARGAIDFLRGRWGPPPASLPGMGDVKNV